MQDLEPRRGLFFEGTRYGGGSRRGRCKNQPLVSVGRCKIPYGYSPLLSGSIPPRILQNFHKAEWNWFPGHRANLRGRRTSLARKVRENIFFVKSLPQRTSGFFIIFSPFSDVLNWRFCSMHKCHRLLKNLCSFETELSVASVLWWSVRANPISLPQKCLL